MAEWLPSQDALVEWHMPPTFEFREGFQEMVKVLAVLLALFAFSVGASFVGAIFHGANLRHAKVPNDMTVFTDADFSGATWINGKVCAEGSIGTCTFVD
jgi:hypothetical protein